MLQFEELRLKLEAMEPDIIDLASAIGLDGLRRQAEELDAQASAPGFWDNMEFAQKMTQKAAGVKAKIEAYERLQADYQDTLTLIELADEAEDLSLLDECKEGVERVAKAIETQRLATLLCGEYDGKNAILNFQAGTGGTEAQDWASMLYRLYTRWAERHGYQYNILDYQDGDEAGIKSASIEILGENAYGYLKSENGVHRLVRGDSSRGHQDGRVPFLRCRWSAHQQDLLCRASDPHPHRYRGGLPERAQPVPKPRQVYGDAEVQAGEDQGAGASG